MKTYYLKDKRNGSMITLRLKENIIAYYLLSPAIIFFVIFHYYPIVSALSMSFFDYRLLQKIHPFVGLQNYIALLHNTEFLNSFVNTFYYTLGTLVFGDRRASCRERV